MDARKKVSTITSIISTTAIITTLAVTVFAYMEKGSSKEQLSKRRFGSKFTKSFNFK